MSVNLCDRALLCDCSPTPFRNFSAEAPDPVDYFAMTFFAGSPPLNAPPGFWTIPGSVPGTCESIVSPQDAQDCATRGAEEKVWDTWVDHGAPVPRFGNAEQTCQLSCPNGEDPFVYTLAAGTVVALSQAEADELAASICLYRANLAKVCIPKPAEVTIDVVLLDDVSRLAKNAKVIAGGVGGFAAAYKNGTIHANDLPASASGEFFVASPDGHWVAGYNRLIAAFSDNATAWDMLSGSVTDLGAGAFGRDGAGATDDGAVLTQGGDGLKLFDASTAALIVDISATAPLGFVVATTNTPSNTYPNPINNSRQVAGRSGLGDGRKLYRWTAGVALNISPPLLAANQNNNKAIAINAAGHVCGTFRDSVFAQDHSWFYDGATTIRLPDFGGIVNAKSINDSDVIVGDALSAGVMSAFRYSTADGITVLPFVTGITPGASGVATDVNNSDWIVGTMDNKGFVYRNGATEKLTDLIPMGSDWSSVDEALFINNLKQVVGRGTYLGVPGTYYIMQLV